MSVNVSFKGLPPHLRNLSVFSTNARGIKEIIKDAGDKAGISIKTSEKNVIDRNPNLFNEDGQVVKSREMYNMLNYYAVNYLPEGTIKTCADLRDALAAMYKDITAKGADPHFLDIIEDY